MIEVSNLWKKFGRHDAIQGLSFSVPHGSAYALIGANGDGKTTTIKILMNIIEATRGDAMLLGVNSRRISPRELAQIGYVSENQDRKKDLLRSKPPMNTTEGRILPVSQRYCRISSRPGGGWGAGV
jgi:ABC-type multidrug transport system ATPase subunit